MIFAGTSSYSYKSTFFERLLEKTERLLKLIPFQECQFQLRSITYPELITERVLNWRSGVTLLKKFRPCSHYTGYFSCRHEKLCSIVYNRLQVVPHFSSGIVERTKRERAWKSPHARKGDTRQGESNLIFSLSPPRIAFLAWGDFPRALAFRSLYYPWGTRSLCIQLSPEREVNSGSWLYTATRSVDVYT